MDPEASMPRSIVTQRLRKLYLRNHLNLITQRQQNLQQLFMNLPQMKISPYCLTDVSGKRQV